MQQDLESGLVFADAQDARDIGHSPTDKGCFEERFGRCRIGLLKESYIEIALSVRGEIGLIDLGGVATSVPRAECEERTKDNGHI